MPRLEIDPHSQVCPDFYSEIFIPTREALANALNITAEEAAANLTATWSQHNAAQRATWQLQEEEDAALRQVQELADQEAALALQAQADREAADALKESEKKKLKMHTFDATKSIGADIIDHPSPYAIERLKKFEYVELWYFSPEGCLDASLSQRSASEDAFGISKSDSDLMVLRPVASVRASRKSVRDELLTWDQMSIGTALFLRHITLYHWPAPAFEALSLFWYKLQNHEIRGRPNGQRILKEYQARVRREWHAALDRKDSGFNIALIDDALLYKITREIFEADCQATLQDVSLPFPSHFPFSR